MARRSPRQREHGGGFLIAGDHRTDFRLVQIPWDITVAEVEDWLPAESLAPVEKCVMAVHILCNR